MGAEALEVYVSGDFNGWAQQATGQLVNIGQGHWTGFIPGVDEGALYKFYIKGAGTTGYKRDPAPASSPPFRSFPRATAWSGTP